MEIEWSKKWRSFPCLQYACRIAFVISHNFSGVDGIKMLHQPPAITRLTVVLPIEGVFVRSFR